MEALMDEVESLEAILMDDVQIIRNSETDIPEIIETTVFPNVGEDTDQQYICVTLQVIPSAGYPDVSPVFKLLKPRGLDDARLAEIKDACTQKLTESIGCSVVFDLIEVIREHLTGSNLPSGQCVVCLYGFVEGDEFTKTECYHYLHSYCLARHLVASRRNYNEEQDKLPAWQRKQSKPFQPFCPVCREAINDEYDHLRTAMPPTELEMAPDFHLTNELRNLQTRLTNLYLHQKSRGGIIDVTAEDNNVISIEPEEQSNDDRKTSEDAVDGSPREESSSIEAPTVSTTQQSNAQTSRQQVNRSNHHSNRSGGSRNSHGSPAVSTHTRYTHEPTNNNYSHHNRRHYNRGRRHHNHGHHHHQQQQQQQQQSQQQGSANDQTACNANNR